MRGEHLRNLALRESISGSSPHARGAQDKRQANGHMLGIIPACAGSTPPPVRVLAVYWDHPRMRGEHLPKSSAVLKREGSSPHARGARF